jgi:hypothetical protein
MTEVTATGSDAVVTATEEKIFIKRKGLFGIASSLSGNGDEVIPMNKVGKVVLQNANALVKGSFQIGVFDKDGTAVAADNVVGWTASVLAGNLKHSVIFGKSAQGEFESLRDFINEQVVRIAELPKSESGPVLGKADELKKLAELLSAGILSQAEFEIEKQKLLQ